MDFSVLYENGFTERKKSPKHFFFRVLGDGIFQRIAFYKHHSSHYPIISFSVCSLYGVLDKALFETQTFVYPQFVYETDCILLNSFIMYIYKGLKYITPKF